MNQKCWRLQLMSDKLHPNSKRLTWDCTDQMSKENTHTHPFNDPFSGTTQVSWYQKGKTNLDFTEARESGSGISWAICKSAPHSRQPRQHPTTQFFTGRMPFLPPNQQRQSIEGKKTLYITDKLCKCCIFNWQSNKQQNMNQYCRKIPTW